jgi:ribose transport system ATP-binding protein
VRENIALPFSARACALGPFAPAHEKRERVAEAVDRLQIDTRAQGEVSAFRAAISRR